MLKLYSVHFGHYGMAVALAETKEEAARLITEERKDYTYGEVVDPALLTEHPITAGLVINDMGDA